MVGSVRYWVRAAVFVLACAILGSALTWSLTEPGVELYESSTRALVGPLSTEPDGGRAGEQLTNTYKEAATSQLVVAEAIRATGLDVDPATVAASMDAFGDPGARLLTVRVRDEDAEQAAALADAIIDALAVLPVEGERAVELVVIDPARPGVVIGNQSTTLGLLGGVVAGGFAVVLLLLVAPPGGRPRPEPEAAVQEELLLPWSANGSPSEPVHVTLGEFEEQLGKRGERERS